MGACDTQAGERLTDRRQEGGIGGGGGVACTCNNPLICRLFSFCATMSVFMSVCCVGGLLLLAGNMHNVHV